MPFFLQPQRWQLSILAKWVEWSQEWSACAHFPSKPNQAKPSLSHGKARQGKASLLVFCLCVHFTLHAFFMQGSLLLPPSLVPSPPQHACLPIRFRSASACNFVGNVLGKMSINARVQLIKRLSNDVDKVKRSSTENHRLISAWVTFHLCLQRALSLQKI